MNFRLTITLIAVLLLTVSTYFFVHSWQQNHPAATDAGPKNLVISPAPTDIKSFSYSEDGKTVVSFANTANVAAAATGASAWQITAPFSAPADSSTIDDLTYQFKNLTYTDKFEPDASGPRSAAATGTDAPKRTIDFTDDKGVKHILGLGKRSVSGIYATVDSGKTIYLLASNPVESLDKSPVEFRSKVIKEIPTENVTGITLQHQGQTVTLTKSPAPENKWLITAPVTARVNNETIDGITNELKAVRATRFLDLKKDATTGLVPPRETITVLTAAPAPSAATAPALAPASRPAPTAALTLELGYYTDPTNRKEVYASVAGTPDVFTISADSFKKLDLQLSDLRDPVVLPGDVPSASAVTANPGPKAVALTRANNDWTMNAAGLPQVPADSYVVGTLLESLHSLRASKFVDAAGDLKSIGLDPPQQTFDITVPNQTQHDVLLIGKPETADNVTPLMLQGDPTLYLVKSDDVAKLNADPLALRDHAVERLDANRIRSIKVTGAGTTPFTLTRDGGTWKVASAGKTETADATRITTILADFTPLNAAKFLTTSADAPPGTPDITLTMSYLEPTQPASQPATQAATLPAELQAAINAIPSPIGPDAGKPVARVLRLFKSNGTWKALWDGPGPQWLFEPTSVLIDHLTNTKYPTTQPATQPSSQPATRP